MSSERKARAVTVEPQQATFSQNMAIGTGGLGLVLVLTDMQPTFGRVLMAAGFLMYYNASGFIGGQTS